MCENAPTETLEERRAAAWARRAPSETPGGTQITLKFGGDATLERMVTVPMPRSLPELQHQAAQHFGHSGCLRLYHHGTHLIYHPSQMKAVKDGDLIVVRRSQTYGRKDPEGTPRALSTHQADFIKHPLTRPATTAGNDYESILTERTKGASLDGMSRYATDYVKHPIEPVTQYKPPSALELHDEPLGTTTYAREFLWREGAVRRVADDRAVRESSLSTAAQAERFDGCSSYSLDFKRRDNGGRRDLAVIPQSLRESSVQPPPTPFSAVSTYSGDFTKLNPARRRPFLPKGDSGFGNEYRFTGSSEYQREYFEKVVTDRSEFIRLAEEAMKSLQSTEAAEDAPNEGVYVDHFPVPTTGEVKFDDLPYDMVVTA